MRTTEQKRQELELIAEIAKRSENIGVGFGDRLCRLMDIEFAHEKFNLDLQGFLNASDFDFAHDFNGIQARIIRATKTWNDDCFVPRFARNSAV